jgi:NAD(P)H-flavin reductase
MNKILSKTYFSERVACLEVEAPVVARARRAGNFVIVRVGDGGERVPLTIAGADAARGTITLVVQAVGVSTRALCALEVGECITDLVGPLGRPTRVERVGTVLACGGGVGIAPLLPIATAFKEAGNRVVSVIAGRGREQVILEREMEGCSDEVIVMTDDGSLGRQGLVTAGMSLVLERERVDLAVVVGPAVMMKFASALTREHGVRTLASLNALMVDGTGMCGACRVTVGGRTRFTCVDGPEFDAHEVDFDELLARLGGFRAQEEASLQQYIKEQEHGTRE